MTTGSTMEDAAAFKAFLMKQDGPNLYEPLSRLLVRVMDERPHGAAEILEELLEELRSGSGSRFGDRDTLRRAAVERLAELQKPLFTRPEDPLEVDASPPLPNVSETSFYLEQAGVGLGQTETFRISLAVRQLVESEALPRCRLWGKVLGTQGNYVVVEVEYSEEEHGYDPEGEEEDTPDREEQGAEPLDHQLLPQSAYKPPPAVPREALGTGTNRFMYYVCSEPGLPWAKLPPVTPAQISAARAVCKLFTGNLDSPVVSHPPFPGNEANYLRAQIARISAGTHVSPQGFYQLGDDEACEANPDFEGIQPAFVCEPSAWVHHSPHILQQGRCTWVNVSGKRRDDSNEELEAEEEEEEEEEELEEMGPQLLMPLNMDAELFGVPPWTCRLSSALLPQHAVAVLRSNLWPGAHAYAIGRKFENFYVGWGLKYSGGGFSPPPLPPPRREYPDGPELAEVLDPSVEDEQALKDALEEQNLSSGHTEEEDEEEEDDDDDDDN